MKRTISLLNASTDRRGFLRGLTWSAAALSVPGLFADELVRTPHQTEGPFYPTTLPLDSDNDLLIINDSITPAVGQITHVSGRILGPTGAPVRNAVVEIWSVDKMGAYLHPGSSRHADRDKNFQGFGRFETASSGEYRFRTIKPVPYDNRTPHIHYAINLNGKRMLTTQLYVEGEAMNEKDGVLKRLKDPKARAAIIKEFRPVKDSKTGELAVTFDVVIGETPEERADGSLWVPRPPRV